MVSQDDSFVIFSRCTVAYGASLGTMMSFLLSFIATMADRVTRLSEMPAANFPMVVPEQGQITTASIGADPEADFAPTFEQSQQIDVHLPITLHAFLVNQGMLPRSVVVELNGEAVSPSEFEEHQLNAGDSMEIVNMYRDDPTDDLMH